MNQHYKNIEKVAAISLERIMATYGERRARTMILGPVFKEINREVAKELNIKIEK